MKNIALINIMKTKMIHFAWDREKDESVVLKNLIKFKDYTGIDRRKCCTYVLTNYNTTFEYDLYRINTLRKIGIDPYVMIYNKKTAPQNIKHLARWVNNRILWGKIDNFYDYNSKLA